MKSFCDTTDFRVGESAAEVGDNSLLWEKMKILQATITDAEEILKLQKLAYQSEAKRYNDYNIPPLKQTISEIKEQFKTYIFLKAVSENKIVGTVRAHEKNETCYVGKLAVFPGMQNQGIGTALMEEIETYFNPRRFELFVGSKSDKNIRLYQKSGYTIYKTGEYECGHIEILYMEKIIHSAILTAKNKST